MTGGLFETPATEETSEAVKDACRFGMSEDAIGSIKSDLSSDEQNGGGVWLRNIAAVKAFIVCSTQWRTSSMMTELGAKTLWVGLDYAGGKIALDARKIEITPELWDGLVTIEFEALVALNGE